MKVPLTSPAWLTAAQAICWIAFRSEVALSGSDEILWGPFKNFESKWGTWPADYLLAALEAIADNRMLLPGTGEGNRFDEQADEWNERARHHLATHCGDAQKVIADLKTDIHQCRQAEEKIAAGEAELIKLVRDGHLSAYGRLASDVYDTRPALASEEVPPHILLGPLTIDIWGRLRPTIEALESGAPVNCPTFLEVHVAASALRALIPSSEKQSASDAQDVTTSKVGANSKPILKLDIEQWYQERAKTLQYSSEMTDMAAAREAGYKIARQRIRDLRKSFAPEEWKAHGRRPTAVNRKA